LPTFQERNNMTNVNTLSNRAIISRLYTSANAKLTLSKFDIDNWSEWYNAVQGLDGPEKMVYIIVKMNQSVTKGGFVEFYEKSMGIFAPELIYVLNEIQANATAEIISSSLPVINLEGLLDDAYKAFVFKITLSEEQKTALFSQDIRYDQLQDHENLEDLLGDYLRDMMESI